MSVSTGGFEAPTPTAQISATSVDGSPTSATAQALAPSSPGFGLRQMSLSGSYTPPYSSHNHHTHASPFHSPKLGQLGGPASSPMAHQRSSRSSRLQRISMADPGSVLSLPTHSGPHSIGTVSTASSMFLSIDLTPDPDLATPAQLHPSPLGLPHSTDTSDDEACGDARGSGGSAKSEPPPAQQAQAHAAQQQHMTLSRLSTSSATSSNWAISRSSSLVQQRCSAAGPTPGSSGRLLRASPHPPGAYANGLVLVEKPASPPAEQQQGERGSAGEEGDTCPTLLSTRSSLSSAAGPRPSPGSSGSGAASRAKTRLSMGQLAALVAEAGKTQKEALAQQARVQEAYARQTELLAQLEALMKKPKH